MKPKKTKHCPMCNVGGTYLVKVRRRPWILPRYYCECRNCYYSTLPALTKRGARRNWNKGL